LPVWQGQGDSESKLSCKQEEEGGKAEPIGSAFSLLSIRSVSPSRTRVRLWDALLFFTFHFRRAGLGDLLMGGKVKM
jgi:hypothetical protein